METDLIKYLNTDLDLTCADDLRPLVAVFEQRGLYTLHVTRSDDGMWQARFETNREFTAPEPNIDAILSAIESLDGSLRKLWMDCTRREFNIGYDFGNGPWAFNQQLSTTILRRLSDVGAMLALTLYPPSSPGVDRTPTS